MRAVTAIESGMPESVRDLIIELASTASVEINVQDVDALSASRDYLRPGTKLYVSHLPKQNWDATIATCARVRDAGYKPVPHIPVRLLKSRAELHTLLQRLQHAAQIDEALLIAGDYAQVVGPYASVDQVLQSFPLQDYGIKRLSFAGHPEGHPKVDRATIRHAEIEKAQIAAALQFETTVLTQFFFEAQPFIEWTTQLRQSGVAANLVGGIAGPASLTTLFKFALRCGVGPSMRALGNRTGSLFKLVGDYGPETLIANLALARHTTQFSGMHLFCFGGFFRTCKWLHAVTNGHFLVDEVNGFRVEQ